jgi:hypothetical protein
MLLELLIDASLPVRDTRFARLLRDIDRALMAMAELDAREERGRQASRALRRISPAKSLPSMTTSPKAMTSAPAI